MTSVVLTCTALATVLADQATKAVVREPVLNARGALVALPARAAAALWVVLAAGAAAWMAAGGTLDAGGAAGLGLLLGGAAGNVSDRLRLGGVRDFVALGPWPAFNLADAALAGGAALLACSAF